MGEDALRLGSLALILLVGGCGSSVDTSRTLSVGEVAENIHSLDGERVKVAGYLAKCGGYDCSLFASKEEAARFWKVASDRQPTNKLPTFLTIGFDEKFDRKAGPLAGHYVLLTGIVSDECTGRDGKPLCLDRGADINPIDIGPLPSTVRPEVQQ